jgi:hypothetical protein
MKKIGLFLIIALLNGCATTTKPVSLAPSFWENKQQSIAVAVTKSNPPDATMTGAQGLLDLAINKGNAKQLIAYLAKMDLPKLAALPNDFTTQLQARGFNTKKIDEPIDVTKLAKFSGKSTETQQFSEYDLSKFKEQGIDRILLISVNRVGTTRNYYGFIPTNPPQADLALTGQLVDLKTHELLWNTTVVNNSPVAEPWDQAPNFDNVGVAVKSNLDQGVEKFEQSFFSGPVQ